MQLDVIQKSILGVLALTGVLAYIAPTNLAPKPPVEKPEVVQANPDVAVAEAPAVEYVADVEDEDDGSFGKPDVELNSGKSSNENSNQDESGYASNNSNADFGDTTEPPMGYIPPKISERRPPNADPSAIPTQ